MPGWGAIIITGIITSISVITIVSTAIAETDPARGGLIHIAPPRFAEISPGPPAIASPMAGGPVRFYGNPVDRDANSIWRGEGLEPLVKAGE